MKLPSSSHSIVSCIMMMMALLLFSTCCYASSFSAPIPLETLTVTSTPLSQYGHILVEFTRFPVSVIDRIQGDTFTLSASFKTSFPVAPDTSVMHSPFIFSIGDANLLSHATFSDNYQQVFISPTTTETKFVKDKTMKLSMVLHTTDIIPQNNAILSDFKLIIDQVEYIWKEQHTFEIVQSSLGVIQLPLYNTLNDMDSINISFPVIQHKMVDITAFSISLRPTFSTLKPGFNVITRDIQCKMTNGSVDYPLYAIFTPASPSTIKFLIANGRFATIERESSMSIICPSTAVLMEYVSMGFINSPFSTITVFDKNDYIISTLGYSFSHMPIHVPIVTTGPVNNNSDLMISITCLPNNLFHITKMNDVMSISLNLDNLTVEADSIQCIGNSQIVSKGKFHSSIISCDIPIDHQDMSRDDPYEVLIIAHRPQFIDNNNPTSITNTTFKTKANLYGHLNRIVMHHTPSLINDDVDFAISKKSNEFYVNLALNKNNIPLNIIDFTLDSNSVIPLEKRAHWESSTTDNKPLLCSFGTYNDIKSTIIDHHTLRLELPSGVTYKINDNIHISCHHNIKAINVNSQKNISTMLTISIYSKQPGQDSYTLESTISQWQSNAKDYHGGDNDDGDNDNPKNSNIVYIILGIFAIGLILGAAFAIFAVIRKKNRQNDQAMYRSLV